MTEKAKIIIVDDEAEILEMLQGLLKSEGYAVRCAQSGGKAIEIFEKEQADVVVTDIRMPGMDGLEVLRTIKTLDSTVEVIVLTGHASIETAVSALKNQGAFDFLTKPLERLEDFLVAVEKAVAHRNLILENAQLLNELTHQKTHLESSNEDLRRTKRALEVSRYRYQNLYDQAPVGYLNISSSGRIEEANETAANLFAIAKNELQNKSIFDLIVPQDRESFENSHCRFLEAMPCASEVRMKKADGEMFHAHLESLAVLNGDGSIDRTRVTICDVTVQKEMESALIESEQRYRGFVQNFKGIAFCLENDGSPAFYHGAVEETSGYRESELMRNRPSWEALIHPDDIVQVQFRRKKLWVSGECNITHEYRIRHRSRHWRWVQEHIQSLRDPNRQGRMLHGVIFDITDQKKFQAQYVESRKLDAIATMAAGIAHQFNNSLAGLMGNLELLQMDVDPTSSAAGYFDPMMQVMHNMTQLTRQLLAYARGGKYMPCKLSAHDLVRDSMNLMEHRISEKYERNIQLYAETDTIVADCTQMQMVLLAVVENAMEAMPDGGVIRIGTRTVDNKIGTVEEGGVRSPGPYICLSVKDNGCGMNNATAEKIFDPFFTTKFIGRGLGLSAAYGIVVNHSGWMEVETSVNQGTDICIYLPLTEHRKPAATEPEPGRLSKGDATILVVEDEEMVLKAIHELLERLEYRVIEAPTGQSAIEVLKTYHGQIDIVLLDVGLPDVRAEDLYQKILDIRPELKVIVCSGYSQDGPAEKLLASGATAFLQKPFSVSRLSTELKAAIENSNSTAQPRLKLV